MIFSSRNYPFNGAVTTLVFPQLVIRISTAKEGVFSKQSTMISLIPNVMAGPSQNRVVAKIMWADALRSKDRQGCHHELAEFMNKILDITWEAWLALDEQPDYSLICPLLEDSLASFRERGMVKEFINLLRG